MAGKARKRRSGGKVLAVPALSLDELIRQQGVGPVTDFNALSALWPTGHDPDAFAKFVKDERAARRMVKPRWKTA